MPGCILPLQAAAAAGNADAVGALRFGVQGLGYDMPSGKKDGMGVRSVIWYTGCAGNFGVCYTSMQL